MIGFREKVVTDERTNVQGSIYRTNRWVQKQQKCIDWFYWTCSNEVQNELNQFCLNFLTLVPQCSPNIHINFRKVHGAIVRENLWKPKKAEKQKKFVVNDSFFSSQLEFCHFPQLPGSHQKNLWSLINFFSFRTLLSVTSRFISEKLLSQGNFFLFVHCFQSVMSPCFLIIKVSSRDIFEKIFPSVDVQICWDFWKFWIWEVLEQKSFLSRFFAISRGNSVLNLFLARERSKR